MGTPSEPYDPYNPSTTVGPELSETRLGEVDEVDASDFPVLTLDKNKV